MPFAELHEAYTDRCKASDKPPKGARSGVDGRGVREVEARRRQDPLRRAAAQADDPR